jgi:hypothetical protein
MGQGFKKNSEVESEMNVHTLPTSVQTLVTRVTKKSPQELIFGKVAHCAHNLRVFGEMGTLTTKKKVQGNLKDQATVFTFVRYPPNHACDVYRMLNLKTKHMIKSSDIV